MSNFKKFGKCDFWQFQRFFGLKSSKMASNQFFLLHPPTHKNKNLKLNLSSASKPHYSYTRFWITRKNRLCSTKHMLSKFIFKIGSRRVDFSRGPNLRKNFPKPTLVKQVASDWSIPILELVNLTKQNWSSKLTQITSERPKIDLFREVLSFHFLILRGL